MRTVRDGGGSDRTRSISIVIRALDEAEHLPLLFDALDRQTIVPDEVIVVDSGSTDETVALSTARGAQVIHIAPEQFSFGRSLNMGCAAADGDVLVFASAHVYPTDTNWLERLVQPFEADDVVLSYGRQRGDERSTFSETQLMERWFPSVSDEDQRNPFCNNANCAVRRSWWELLPYDEDLTGLEDLDWANRALLKGGRIVYRADATVAHVHDETFDRIRNRYRREAIAHRRIFHDQHLGVAGALALCVANVARDYGSAAARGVLRRNLGAIPRFRAAQYLGTWQGFRSRGAITSDLRRRFYYPKGFERPATTRRART